MTNAQVRPRRFQSSLRHQLPLLILALLSTMGLISGWVAYREFVQALRLHGDQRTQYAATQLAELLAQSAAARLADTRRLTADPALARLLVGPAGTEKGDASDVLRVFVSRNRQARICLYDGRGALLGYLAIEGNRPALTPTTDQHDLPSVGISELYMRNDRVSYRTTAPVLGRDEAAMGYVSVERPLTSSSANGLIERLVGAGATVKFGNATGDVWTDLSASITEPPDTQPGGAASRVDGGDARIGMAAAVSATPWMVWVGLPEGSLLQPAHTFVRRMIPISLVLVAVGLIAIRMLSSRITRPLEQLADAADAIAAGDYARRVAVTRRNEIGRLAAAFNLMATRVAESHEALESRVEERTRDLERAREELDQFFSLSLDLLCIAGTDGRFRRVNPAWEQVLGWTSADLTAIPYLDLVHPDDRAATESEAAKLAEGGLTLSFENRYRTKDGGYRWLSWKAVPLPDRELIYAAAHDITEQKHTERALHQYAADLTSANRELESFSYSVSHDLRAPLRSIDGFAQALVEDYEGSLDETGRDYLSRIRAAAQRMGALIDDLLSLARVTRAELTRMPVDLSALANEAAARLREQSPDRRVEWRIPGGIVAEGDSRLLRLALDNLLENAWKFTAKRDDAVIDFGVMTQPEGVRTFYVRDNGAGFDMGHAKKLFGAFQRLHGAAEYPGTGIGLATVQRIVRRHAGRIWAEAGVGAGATFFFTLEAQ